MVSKIVESNNVGRAPPFPLSAPAHDRETTACNEMMHFSVCRRQPPSHFSQVEMRQTAISFHSGMDAFSSVGGVFLATQAAG